MNVAATDKTQRNNGVFSYVSDPLQHTKIRDLVLQTQITFYLQYSEYSESFTPTKTKQLLLLKRKV